MVYILLPAQAQGRQHSSADHVIKFSAGEEVCGWQRVAEVLLFIAGQSHQPREAGTVPIDLVSTTEVLFVGVLLNANNSGLFSPAPEQLLHLKILTVTTAHLSSQTYYLLTRLFFMNDNMFSCAFHRF